MCMRKLVLNVGEKVFNVLVVLGFIAGAASAIFSGISMGGSMGAISAVVQLVISWSGTLIVALVVYSLLTVAKYCICNGEGAKTEGCKTN